MVALKNMVGLRFGRLVVLSRHGDKCPAWWLCRCDCGKEKITCGPWLRDESVSSCGCYRAERMTKRNTKHGMRDTPEYHAWLSMRDRCHNPKHKAWKNYGGRGISVCAEWRTSFPAFFAHIGPRPPGGYSLDKINNDGNYEPGNVRWATAKQQAQNRRSHTRGGRGQWVGWKRN